VPKLDGWEILARLRKIKKTPVLMLTARDQSRDRVRGLDTGADDYVVKPFDLPELFARLRALIRRSANKSSNIIGIGDVKIDTAARNVLLKDKVMELTAREYALVEFMALHRGEVVTRTQLYEHLFDENDDTFSNLLDVHVSNVRKKLGAEFINAPATDPAYVRTESFLLAAFSGLPKIEVPAAAVGNKPRIFELRTYESHSKKANKKKIEMFNTGEIDIFRRTGLQPVFFGETLAGSKMPSLTYMLTFENMAEREKHWAAFIADPEWKKMSTTPGFTDVEIVSNISNIFLRPASYSQI